MIAEKVQNLIQEAMKARDKVRVSTLRLLSSAFNYERIAKQHDLTEEEEIAVIRRQVKQRRDSIEAYKKVGAMEQAKREEEELKILQEFLPPEVGEKEIGELVDLVLKETGASSIKDLGRVIGAVKAKVPNADGAVIAAIVKQKLGVESGN